MHDGGVRVYQDLNLDNIKKATCILSGAKAGRSEIVSQILSGSVHQSVVVP